MRVWQCQRTPIKWDKKSFIQDSNLCKEIIVPMSADEYTAGRPQDKILDEPGWLISMIFSDITCPIRGDMVVWLNEELQGRYIVANYHHFSLYESLDLKLNDDDDMALFRLKYGEYFDNH